jgi:hypothetical protein
VNEWLEGRYLRGASLGLGALASVFATPYGLELLGYYRSTMGNPLFTKYISEWAPPTFPTWAGAPFFLIAVVGVVLIARHPRVLTRFEIAALALTLAGGLTAVRSIVWFTYASVLLLPRVLDRAWPVRVVARQARTVVALVAVATFLLGAGFAVDSVVHGSRVVRSIYPPAAVDAVRAAIAHDPHVRVLGDDRTSDRLLYEVPALKGRIAFDGRWEVLSRPQFQAARDYLLRGAPNVASYARRYGIFVVDPTFNKKLAGWYDASGLRVLYRGSRVVVYER